MYNPYLSSNVLNILVGWLPWAYAPLGVEGNKLIKIINSQFSINWPYVKQSPSIKMPPFKFPKFASHIYRMYLTSIKQSPLLSGCSHC